MTGGGGNGAPGGSNTQIQYNDSGAFGGNTGFTFNEVNGNVNIPGNLVVASNITGTLLTAAQNNITSVGALVGLQVTGPLNVSSNTIFGNVLAGNTANITGNANANNFNGTLYGNVNGNLANVTGSGANLTNLNASNLSSGTVPVARLSGTYNISITGSVSTANTVTNNAQPNITSVGTLTDLRISNTSIHLGNNSASTGYQGGLTVAIGNNAGSANLKNEAIAIGNGAGIGTSNNVFYGQYAISIGTNSGSNADSNSISVGVNSGNTAGGDAISVGPGSKAQGDSSSAIGRGPQTGATATNSIAIGTGVITSAIGGVAIGSGASATSNSVSVGVGATSVAWDSVAIGFGAGTGGAANNSIAIGNNATASGGSGFNGIVIGTNAMTVGNSIALGAYSNSTIQNNIVINASGSNLYANTANALFIKPVRTVNSTAGLNQLYYNSTTGEIVVYVP
jgi:hypothetical protein